MAQNQQNKNYEENLLDLRQNIDQIDDTIIALLIKRMQIVKEVGRLKTANKAKFFIRSNREADMIRNLIKKSQNKLPKLTIFNIWRQIITMANLDEQPINLAIYNPNKNSEYEFLVKNYYNLSVETNNFSDLDQVLDQANNKNGTIAAFALPNLDDNEQNEQNWWINLAKNYPNLTIFAKIPQINLKNQQNDYKTQLLLVANKEHEQSSDDNSLFYFKITTNQCQNNLEQQLKQQNINYKILKTHNKQLLVELEGFFSKNDPKLSKIANLILLGHYASF